MEIVSRPHARSLVAWAKDRPRALVLSADLTSSCEANEFRDAYPDRFFSLGMAEQNLMSFAGGLAREGFVPLVHSFGVFLTRRPYDQVAMSIGYPCLPVRLFGFLPGITTPGGVTHQAIDDVALMRSIPNFTVVECGDATEVEGLLPAIESVPGPVYVRMLRGEVPRLFPVTEPLRLGRARVLADGEELLILSSGIGTEAACRVVPRLRARGIAAGHLHVSTLKPFADPTVLEALGRARRGVVTLENHLVTGGLGSAVAELMAEAGLGVRLLRLGLRDEYAHGASRAYLERRYGLDARGLVAGIERLLGVDLAVGDDELDAVELGPGGARPAGAVGTGRVEDL